MHCRERVGRVIKNNSIRSFIIDIIILNERLLRKNYFENQQLILQCEFILQSTSFSIEWLYETTNNPAKDSMEKH